MTAATANDRDTGLPLSSRRMIRLKQVMEVVPLSRSTIYERMADGTFPASFSLGGGVSAWYERDIIAWLESCPENKKGVSLGVAA